MSGFDWDEYNASVERADKEAALVEAAIAAPASLLALTEAMELLAASESLSEDAGHFLADAVLAAALRLAAGDDAEPLLAAYERVFKWYA